MQSGTKRKSTKGVPIQLAAEIGKIPPQAVDLEEGILGAMLFNNRCIDTVLKVLRKKEVFYKEAHQYIFEAIVDLYIARKPVDIKTAYYELKKRELADICGGPYYISKLTDAVSNISNVEYWCFIVLEKYIGRETIRASSEFIQKGFEDGIDVLDMVRDFQKSIDSLTENTKIGVNAARRMTFNHVKQENKTVISIKQNGKMNRILSKGNIGLWIAPPGTGKSQLIEVVGAAAMNEEIDTLGFDVKIGEGKKVLIIDTERDYDDLYDGMMRMKKRVGEAEPDFYENNEFKKVDIWSFRSIIHWQDRRVELRKQIETEKYDLVLIDGYGHFVGNTNDPEQCDEFVGELMAYANEYKVAILGTLHNNFKQKDNQSARGHLGAALMREAESYFIIKRSPTDRSVRILSSKVGENQKNRSGADDLEIAFKWDDDKRMFVGVDHVEIPKKEADTMIEKTVRMIFEKSGIKEYTMGDLVRRYSEITGKSESTAKRHITGTINKIIVKDGLRYKIFTGEMFDDDEAPY